MKYKFKGLLSLVSLLLLPASFISMPKRCEYVYTGADVEYEETAFIPVGDTDGVKISTRISELFSKDKQGEEKRVIVGGTIFGAQVKTSCVTVMECRNQKHLKEGDVIVRLEGNDIRSVGDVERVMKESDGQPISAIIRRNGSIMNTTLLPHESAGEYKLGIRLKDTAAGIGTVTYIDPETGEFGGLGHGICDPETGEVIPIRSGEVCGVMLEGVKKGESGKPGELSGILTDRDIGDVWSNTECGIFGKLETLPDSSGCCLMEIGKRSEVKVGKAYIYSTVKNGKKTKFDIEITEVDTSSHGTKSFKIKVTDPTLKAITGGIVRGMSGSPIIQNGKLVGAVTHVMVADPTEGYGIFIENMLNAAQMPMQKAA